MTALNIALIGRGSSANDGTGDSARDGALKLNKNARLLEAIAKGAVISATTTAQPASPTVGDLYIIPSGKTGADWSTMTNGSLALYAENDGANAWFEITPAEGWRVYARDTNVYYYHNGSTWTALISAAMTHVVQAATRRAAGIEEIVVTAYPYNAVGDGVADDAAAIQAAYDAAVALGRPARVFLPAGTFGVSTGLDFNSTGTAGAQVEVVGAGSHATVIQCLSGFNDTEVIRFGPAASSTTRQTGGLRGFSVDGNNLAGAGTVGGVYLWNAYRSSFEDLSVNNVTEDGIVSAGHASGVAGDPCNQGNFFLQIYNRNCDGDGLYTRGEKASIFDEIHGDACGGYAFFMDSETVGGNTETTENIVGSVMARNCDAGGMAISGAAKLNAHAIHAHICNGPALHIRSTASGTTAPVYYSNIVQVVSRNCKGSIVTELGNASTKLFGCSIGSALHVGAYPAATHTGFVALGWYGTTIGSINIELNPGTCVRFADQTGSTNNYAVRVGAIMLDSNGDAGAADNHGVSIEGGTADLGIAQLRSANAQTKASTSSYELKTASTVSSVRIGECFLDANQSGYELSIADATKVEFLGSKKIDGSAQPVDAFGGIKIPSGKGLIDANGNELILLTTTASAVNEVTMANAATGNNPSLAATGGDANISLLLAGKGTGGVIVGGTGTNDNAAAGKVGEIIESTVLVGSAVSLTTGTPANITSISLTAGDWDVWGSIATSLGASTQDSEIRGDISTTSATFPTAPNSGGGVRLPKTATVGQNSQLPVGRRRISLSATTTVYLVMQVNFTVSTAGGYGYLGARRVR